MGDGPAQGGQVRLGGASEQTAESKEDIPRWWSCHWWANTVAGTVVSTTLRPRAGSMRPGFVGPWRRCRGRRAAGWCWPPMSPAGCRAPAQRRHTEAGLAVVAGHRRHSSPGRPCPPPSSPPQNAFVTLADTDPPRPGNPYDDVPRGDRRRVPPTDDPGGGISPVGPDPYEAPAPRAASSPKQPARFASYADPLRSGHPSPERR